MFYSQVTNISTSSTADFCQRFGLLHYNMTGGDDILSMDYLTGDFDSVHGVTANYG